MSVGLGSRRLASAVGAGWEVKGSFPRRVGEFGGYAVLETDNGADVYKLTAAFTNFQVRLEPVLEVREAVAAEAEASAGRASTTSLSYPDGGNSGKERMIRTKAEEDWVMQL